VTFDPGSRPPLQGGTLYVVATPIGNLEDITFRALRVLGQAAAIYAEDTRAAERLLAAYGLPAGGRVVSCFEGNEARRAEEIAARLAAGEALALISEAGLPGVSDPGQRVIADVLARGGRIEVVPGASAALTALVVSGLPSDRFLFLGFPPRKSGARRELFGGLRNDPATLILYEAPGRTGETLGDLVDALGPHRRAVVCRELTKLHEEHVRGTLDELGVRYASEAPRGEVTIVIEGAPPDARVAELDIEAAVRDRLAAGESPKEVAAALALATGKPRRMIYQLALALRR
jgi:16S rRNA (cytidine1402-2'-O)-methyltransferase